MTITRSKLRTVLLLAGIVPALLAFVVLLKVAVMMSHDSNGREAFSGDDFTPAAEHFDANHTWNWFEPWIAPFDEGAAVHADGEYEDALELYGQALETVPEVEECTVRINMALAHEALGDAAKEGPPPDPAKAIEFWKAGLEDLAGGDCPKDSGRGKEQTEAAKDVDERLREKIEQQEEQQQQQGGDQEQEKTPKEEDLEERNDEGKEERKNNQGGQDDQQGQGQGQDEGRQGGGSGGQQGGGGSTPEPKW